MWPNTLLSLFFGFTGRSKLDEALPKEGLNANVVYATDADVIKTYVHGLGNRHCYHMAYDPIIDSDLVALSADHLFEPVCNNIGFREEPT